MDKSERIVGRWRKTKKVSLLLACSVVFLFLPPGTAFAERSARGDYDWALTLYGGFLTESTLGEIIMLDLGPDSDFGYVAAALTRKITEISSALNLEGEGVIVKYTKGQDHLELNALVAGRWLDFPWNRHIDTTGAFGLGLSFAAERPSFEVENKGTSEQLLAFLLFEITVGIPDIPQWEIVGRINHRSGAFGVFNGVNGAMNSFAVGIKHRF